jgi:Zn-dependent protease
VSQLSFRPLAWLGLVIIIVVHEAGHAFLLRRYRLPVLWIVLHGFGGECETVEWLTPWQRAVVAWGGVLAQAGLFAALIFVASFGLWPPAFVASDLYTALGPVNVLVACFNLLPFGKLDGREAWRIVWFGYLRGKHSWLRWRLSKLEVATTKASSNKERLH